MSDGLRAALVADKTLSEAWDGAGETGCPYQRYSRHPALHDAGVWLAIATEPPCQKKVCGQNGCHNFGKPFDAYCADRFAVVPDRRKTDRRTGVPW